MKMSEPTAVRWEKGGLYLEFGPQSTWRMACASPDSLGYLNLSPDILEQVTAAYVEYKLTRKPTGWWTTETQKVTEFLHVITDLVRLGPIAVLPKLKEMEDPYWSSGWQKQLLADGLTSAMRIIQEEIDKEAVAEKLKAMPPAHYALFDVPKAKTDL